MATYVLRVWIPDRPGALGAVASRIGSVGADVVGIDILERGGGRAIDELLVELPDPSLLELMVAEMQQVDGVDVETAVPAADSLRDPRLDALETAAILVGASDTSEVIEALCTHAIRTIGATWGAVVDIDDGDPVVSQGEVPTPEWMAAFLAGSRSSARLHGGGHGPDDVAWAPLPAANLALLLGREGTAFRARERRQASALARIADTRFRELRRQHSRARHPSMT